MEKFNNNQFGRTSEVLIRTGSREGVTELEDVYFTAPYKVMRPFSRGKGWKEIMIMSVSAGTMEGDRQSWRMEIGSGSKVLVTSQSYEKIHRMKEGFAQRETNIVVESDAVLYYRPQPVIPFAGSDFRSKTKVILNGKKARLIMSDILCSGRVAMGEQFAYQYYSNLVEIYKVEIGCETDILKKNKEEAAVGKEMDIRKGPVTKKEMDVRKGPVTRKEMDVRKGPVTRKEMDARRGPVTRKESDVRKDQVTRKEMEREKLILSYRDNTRYEPQNPDMDMKGFGMYEGYGYLLNLLFCNIPIDKGQLEMVRSCLEKAEEEQITGGITCTWDGDLVIRALGNCAEELERLSEKLVGMVVKAVNGTVDT